MFIDLNCFLNVVHGPLHLREPSVRFARSHLREPSVRFARSHLDESERIGHLAHEDGASCSIIQCLSSKNSYEKNPFNSGYFFKSFIEISSMIEEKNIPFT